MKSEVKLREHGARDSDLGRSTNAQGHRTEEMRSRLAGDKRLLCPHKNELQMQQHNTNASSENNLCRLQQGGFLYRLRLCLCAAVDTCLKRFGTSAAPKKRGLKDSPNAKRFRLQQSLRRGYCRTEAAFFPRSNLKNLPRVEENKELAVIIVENGVYSRKILRHDVRWIRRRPAVAEQEVERRSFRAIRRGPDPRRAAWTALSGRWSQCPLPGPQRIRKPVRSVNGRLG